MLKWCMYCQEFQGEVPPFDQLTTTHGVCATCFAKDDEVLQGMIGQSRRLSAVQGQLAEAGRAGNLPAAETILEAAYQAGLRPIDIVLGMITPLLFTIGEEWSKGVTSVAEEHRFTLFCERVFQLIEERVSSETPAAARGLPVEFLLMNAPQNHHTLAIRMLALWLVCKGRRAVTIYPSPRLAALAGTLKQMQPKALLISLALAEQRSGAVEIVDFVTTIPDLVPPQIIVGGYAVKLGLVAPIPGAMLLADIHSL